QCGCRIGWLGHLAGQGPEVHRAVLLQVRQDRRRHRLLHLPLRNVGRNGVCCRNRLCSEWQDHLVWLALKV
ncbi:hypothetical protein H4S06_001343, partial [Coemansia sp. BCRC 34490]